MTVPTTTVALVVGPVLLGCAGRSLVYRQRVRRQLRLAELGPAAPPAPAQSGRPPLPASRPATAPHSHTTVRLPRPRPGGHRQWAHPPAPAPLQPATATPPHTTMRLPWLRPGDGRRARRRQLPGALERLAAALRAGASVPAALAEAGAALPAPIGPELSALGRSASAGRPVTEVLGEWATRNDDAGTRLAATALVLAATVGGAPGRAVDGVARTVRERLELADDRRALAGQARLSALVLAAAPVALALLLTLAGGGPAAFLLGTPVGWACLVVGIGLDVTGAWWMARLTRGGPET